MFKLPLLQPHLTNSANVEARSAAAETRARSNSNSRSLRPNVGGIEALVSTVELKGWQAQAQDLTRQLIGSDKYRSLSVLAEVRLAEALERCSMLSPPEQSEDGANLPTKLKTAVCCQLLGEFASLCGPFASVLTTLRDELARSIYSGLYTTERGALSFDQLPWFVVAERLQQDTDQMVRERELFKQELLEQQRQLVLIEEQMLNYKRATETAEVAAAELRLELSAFQKASENDRIEARAAREELRKLRKELMRSQDELQELKVEHAELERAGMQAEAQAAAQLSHIARQLSECQWEAAEARELAASRLAPEEAERLHKKINEVEVELAVKSQQVIELTSQLDRMGNRTPRPNWTALKPFGDTPLKGSTIEAVGLLVRRNRERDQLVQRLAVTTAMLHGDPPPQPWRLAITAESSQYFITEEPSTSGKPAESAEGLGLVATVPRFLRCAQTVSLLPMDVAATEELIQQIWRERLRSSCSAQHLPLQSFLFDFLHARHKGALDAVTQQGYSLVSACQKHGTSSPSIRLFWKVLSGQLPEVAVNDQRAMLGGVAEVARAVSVVPYPEDVAGQDDSVVLQSMQAEERSIETGELCDALQHYFPSRSEQQLQGIRDALDDQFPQGKASLADVLSTIAALEGSGTASSVQQLLQTQHLEEIERYMDGLVDDLSKLPGATAMAASTAASRDGTGAGAPVESVVRCMLSFGIDAGAVEWVVAEVMELADQRLVKGVLEAGKSLQMERLLRFIHQVHLLKPHNYDVAAALDWCAKLRAQPLAGGASSGGLPDVA